MWITMCDSKCVIIINIRGLSSQKCIVLLVIVSHRLSLMFMFAHRETVGHICQKTWIQYLSKAYWLLKSKYNFNSLFRICWRIFLQWSMQNYQDFFCVSDHNLYYRASNPYEKNWNNTRVNLRVPCQYGPRQYI